MKPMPLLIDCRNQMMGPLVPIFGQLKKVRSEGLGTDDRVEVTGLGVEVVRMITLDPDSPEQEMDLSGCGYVQAHRIGSGSSVHVWLEDCNNGNPNA